MKSIQHNNLNEVERTYTAYGKVFFQIKPGGRILIDDQETTDVERIGARFREWAKSLCPEVKKEEGGNMKVTRFRCDWCSLETSLEYKANAVLPEGWFISYDTARVEKLNNDFDSNDVIEAEVVGHLCPDCDEARRTALAKASSDRRRSR